MEDNIYDYHRLGSRFNKVVSLLIIVVLCFLIFYFVTSAWFGESEKAPKVFIIGDISLSVESDLEFPEYLEPNKMYENMLTTITCTDGTDDAYIKVKVETNYSVANHHVVYPVLYVTDEHAANGQQSWIYSEGDDCYYYVGYVSPDLTATFNTGFVVTNDINNIDKSQPVEVKITVYAIQRYYGAYKYDEDWAFAPAEWKQEIADYDVSDCPYCSELVVGGGPCANCGQ